MKYREDKKSAYLTGYQDLSLTDEMIKSAAGTKWKSDWEVSGEKKPYNYSEDLITRGKMYKESDTLFRYSLDDISTMYEDPTFLGFDIKFDSINSPLFNYGDFPPVATEEPVIDKKKDSGVNVFPNKAETPDTQKTEDEKKSSEEQQKKTEDSSAQYQNASALSFIRKYGPNIEEIKKREPIYFNFMYTLDSLFSRTNSTNSFIKSYYVEMITGMDKFSKKMINYGDDKITIQLSEDVSLRSSYLAELYNNLIYSYKNQRYLIPDNCLRFDMMISVTDMRIFKYLDKVDDEIVSKINIDPPRIVYTLHDCNFDFTNSLPFQAGMTVGGLSQGAPSNHSILTLDIKYKSISKSFRSSLIYGSLEIHNKLQQLINSKILTRSEVFQFDIDSEQQITIQEEQDAFSNSESIASENENINIEPQTINQDFMNIDFEKRKSKISDLYDGVPILFDQEGHPDHVRGDNSSDENTHNHQLENQNPNYTGYKESGIGTDLDGVGVGGKKLKYPKKPSFKEKLKDMGTSLGNQLIETAIENIDDYKDKLIAKYNDIRGELLQDMLRQVREPLNLPKIYPDNVYSADFRSLSLETFAKGLGSDLLNDTIDAAGGGLLGATNLPS